MCFFLTAICGVLMYNYLKVKDVRASQPPIEGIAERTAKVDILSHETFYLLHIYFYCYVVKASYFRATLLCW